MDFEARAQRAADRGDVSHAILLLVEGIEHQSARESALDLLLELYVEQLESPGVESDLVDALTTRPETADYLGRIHRRLRQSNASDRLRALQRELDDRNLSLGGRVDPAISASPDSVPPDGTISSSSSDATTDDPVEHASSHGDEPSPRPPEEAPTEPPTHDDSEEADSVLGAWTRPATIAALLLCLGGAWYLFAQYQSHERLERRLRRLDTTRLEELNSLFDRLPSTRPIREHRWFVQALEALERGEVYQLEGTPRSSWGIAAAAMAALTRDDLERSVRAETKLRRMSEAKLLPQLWIEGRVAEYRGQLESAREHYRRGSEVFPKFVPFRTARIRIAIRRLDRSALQSAVEALESLNTGHPYVRLRRFPMPEMLRREREIPSAHSDAFGLEHFRFGRLVRRYLEALDALDRHRWSRAQTQSERALDIDDEFTPARWVRAVACAAQFQTSCADESLESLARWKSLSMAYQWRLRVLGPRLLRTSGRADLAMRYVLPGFDDVWGASQVRDDDETGSRSARLPRPIGSRPPNRSDDRLAPLRHRARLERMRVLASLGRLREAHMLFERAPTSDRMAFDYDLLGAELEIYSGRRPLSRHALESERRRGAPALAMAFHVGAYAKATEMARALRSTRSSPHPRVARYLALGYASRGRGRRAMQVLVETDPAPSDVPLLRRLRLRIRARLSQANDREHRTFEELPLSSATSSTGYLVDATSIAMWSARLERAGRTSERALRRRPRDPEAHWFQGLVSRLEGRERRAERHLQRSWRTEGADHRLELELGHVHLALGHYERARHLFFHAVLVDNSSLEAIRGLGRACLGLGDETGRWNFRQILESYEDSGVGDLYVAELLRWIAIFHGSREGRDEAKSYLDRARSTERERPIIMMETARWFEARDQLDRARQLYVESLEIDATLAEAHLGLARVAREQTEPNVARTHLKRYLALEPGSGPKTERARRKLERLEQEIP